MKLKLTLNHMTFETLPADLLRVMVYASGLRRLEDRTSLVLSCRSILAACGGVDGVTGRIAADGGEMHWRREARTAGFGHQQASGREEQTQKQRSLYFERRALSCVCCDVRITHRSGRISTVPGIHGRGVHLSTCMRCGPLVRTRVEDGRHRVFGCYASRRQLDIETERIAAERRLEREAGRAMAVRSALALTGMSPQRAELALVGSASYLAYVTRTAATERDDGNEEETRRVARAALSRTIANICRRHWINNFTWLPCACLLCGPPYPDATKDHLYGIVLQCYGGYPPVWPWDRDAAAEADREILADRIVEFYAHSMMLDSLFQRLVRDDLLWMGDRDWLRRIRDAVVGMCPPRRTRRRTLARVTFVASPPSMRIALLVLEAEIVGGYDTRQGMCHVTFAVQ